MHVVVFRCVSVFEYDDLWGDPIANSQPDPSCSTVVLVIAINNMPHGSIPGNPAGLKLDPAGWLAGLRALLFITQFAS